MNEGRHIYLVDGSGFIFRAFHALPPLTRGDGTPVNAVLGFCNMIYKLERDADCDATVVLFDTARVTFRRVGQDALEVRRVVVGGREMDQMRVAVARRKLNQAQPVAAQHQTGGLGIDGERTLERHVVRQIIGVKMDGHVADRTSTRRWAL